MKADYKKQKVHYTLRCRVVKIASEHVRYAKKMSGPFGKQEKNEKERKSGTGGSCFMPLRGRYFEDFKIR